MILADDAQLVHWLALFGQNIVGGMMMVAVYATFRAVVEDGRVLLRSVVIGLLCGVSAAVSMSFPVQIHEGLKVDLRSVFVLVGSLFGGPIGAAVSTGLAAAFRAYIGGGGAVAGIAGIASAGVIGFLFARLARRRQNDFGLMLLLASGLLNAIASIVWVRLVFWLEGRPGAPLEAEEAFILMSPVANIVLGTLLASVHPSVWRKTERQLADLVETTSDLVWETGADGRFTFASDRYLDVIGVPAKEILGKTPEELGWRPVDQAARYAYKAAITARKPFRGVSFVQSRPNGEPRLISVTGLPVLDRSNGFAGYRGAASDITEIERLRALTATISAKVGNVVGEDFLRTLLQTLAEVLGVRVAYMGRYNRAKGTVRGIFLYSQGKFMPRPEMSYAGRPAEIVLEGKPVIVPARVKDFYPSLDESDVFDDAQAYAAIPLLGARGEVIGLLSVSDVRSWDSPEYIETVLNLFGGRAAAEVERVAIDEEREESRRKMAEVVAALDVARDAIIMITDDGRVVYHNRSAGEMMGLPEGIESATGRMLREWAIDRRFDRLADEALSVLRNESEWRGSGTWVRPSDGQTLVFDAHARRLPAGGAVIVATDATARAKLQEEELRNQQREAQAGKLEALGNLAGGIAHDFNNLLGAILGFGQFLIEDLDGNSPQRRYAERIVGVSQRGRSLVQQILTFSRNAKIEPTNVPLAEAIAEIHDMLRVTLPATTQLVVHNDAGDSTIFADKGQLVQVMVNLCVNGSDALADEPGTVEISVAPLDRRRPELARLPPALGKPTPAHVDSWRDADGAVFIATGALPPEDCISLAVTDTGSGIPDTIVGQIFEPFRTTKRVGRGTGLGLAVVHRIVREHGGAILVRTVKRKGTRFEILLGCNSQGGEVAREPADRSAPAAATEASASILVVDDDTDYCDMVKTALTRLGHRVDTTNDPRVALGWVRHGEKNWDILVTDQTMPYMRGRDLIRGFKALSANTRCIICSGYSSGMNEQEAIAAGADAFMMKPFDVGQLGRLVANLVKPNQASGSAVG